MAKNQTSKPAVLTPSPIASDLEDALQDVVPLKCVSIINNEYLGTGGLELGGELTGGRFAGGRVVGLYATPLGFLYEIQHGDETVTLVQNGANTGVLA